MAWGFHRFGLHFRGIPYIVVRQAKTNSPEIWRNRNIALPGAQCAPLQGYAVGAPQRAASWTHRWKGPTGGVGRGEFALDYEEGPQSPKCHGLRDTVPLVHPGGRIPRPRGSGCRGNHGTNVRTYEWWNAWALHWPGSAQPSPGEARGVAAPVRLKRHCLGGRPYAPAWCGAIGLWGVFGSDPG